MATRLRAKTFLGPHGIVEKPIITIEGERIASIDVQDGATRLTQTEWDFPDGIVAPGLFDIHMHGAAGHDVMEATPDALHLVSAFLASRGVSHYLATTVTASLDNTLQALDGIAQVIERGPEADEARLSGIHIEGPFVSHAKRGMHPEQWIVPPTPFLLNRLWEASRGRIKLMTIAPEVEGALQTIERATQLGIRCSIGHSNATWDQAQAAVQAGATTATHTFNAMRPLDHRSPGILGYVLDAENLYSDLISDGIHVHPALVRLWFKAKGPERAILITDSLEAAGMPNGSYKLGNTAVHVENGRCTTESGTLAGSVLTLNEAVARFASFTGVEWKTIVRLASSNPMKMLGLSPIGHVGTEASFSVLDEQANRIATILRGKLL